jgi:hypothetical protein
MSALIDLASANICGTCMLGETKSSFNYQDLLALRGECVYWEACPKLGLINPRTPSPIIALSPITKELWLHFFVAQTFLPHSH